MSCPMFFGLQTTTRTLTSETPLFLAFVGETIIPVEVGMPNLRRITFSHNKNDD